MITTVIHISTHHSLILKGQFWIRIWIDVIVYSLVIKSSDLNHLNPRLAQTVAYFGGLAGTAEASG